VDAVGLRSLPSLPLIEGPDDGGADKLGLVGLVRSSSSRATLTAIRRAFARAQLVWPQSVVHVRRFESLPSGLEISLRLLERGGAGSRPGRETVPVPLL
jgi:hypothetical protein